MRRLDIKFHERFLEMGTGGFDLKVKWEGPGREKLPPYKESLLVRRMQSAQCVLGIWVVNKNEESKDKLMKVEQNQLQAFPASGNSSPRYIAKPSHPKAFSDRENSHSLSLSPFFSLSLHPPLFLSFFLFFLLTSYREDFPTYNISLLQELSGKNKMRGAGPVVSLSLLQPTKPSFRSKASCGYLPEAVGVHLYFVMNGHCFSKYVRRPPDIWQGETGIPTLHSIHRQWQAHPPSFLGMASPLFSHAVLLPCGLL